MKRLLLLLFVTTGAWAQSPTLTSNPSTIGFNSTQIGNISEVYFQLVNVSSAAFDVTTESAAAPFSVDGAGRYTLAPNGSVTLGAVFSPLTPGNYSGGLHIDTSVAGLHITIPLSATAFTGPDALDAIAEPFGTVAVGSNSTWTATLSNQGTKPINLLSASTNMGVFTITPLTIPQAFSNTLAVQVVFTPTATISYKDALILTTDGQPSTFTVPITGTGGASASYYVDSSVGSSGDGHSWATAWKGIGNITGVPAGGIVYFSGGSTSQVYALPGGAPWSPAGGTSGHPITYAVGQDAGHNGQVIFDGGGAHTWITTPGAWVTIDGHVGTARHMSTQNFNFSTETILAQASTGFVVKWVTFPDNDSINFNGNTTAFEVANNALFSNFDHAITWPSPGTGTVGYGLNSIHDNIITLDQKNDGSGWGSDGIQAGNSMDIYNNTFIGNSVSNYPSGQHQDAIQTDGQYIRFYNNTCRDMGNTCVFFEMFGTSTGPDLVYNNVIYMSDTRYAGGGQQAIAIGRSGGASGNVTFSNFFVANNTVANYGNVAVSMTPGAQTTWNNTDQFYNNLSYNTAGYQIDSNVAGNASATNINTSTGGATIFKAYQAPSSSPFAYDFHLTAAATAERGAGANLSSNFTTDHDGVPRGSSWDVGAYQYVP